MHFLQESNFILCSQVRSGRDLVSNFDDMHFLTSSASALSKLYLADIPVESALRNANSKRGTAESLLFVGENKDNGNYCIFYDYFS